MRTGSQEDGLDSTPASVSDDPAVADATPLFVLRERTQEEILKSIERSLEDLAADSRAMRARTRQVQWHDVWTIAWGVGIGMVLMIPFTIFLVFCVLLIAGVSIGGLQQALEHLRGR